jgi:hypothetical protein
VLTAPKGPVTVYHRWIENGIVVFEKKMIVHGKKDTGVEPTADAP